MRVASYLLASASLIVAVSAASKPYAPDLFARSALLDDVEVMVPRLVGKAPYAPELFSRAALHEDSFDIKKRFIGESAAPALQARHWACNVDQQCGPAGYCSTTKGRCFTKINDGKKCSRDAACQSGYCSNKSNTCKTRATKNNYCECDGHCANGYDCINKKCKSSPPKPSHPSKPDHNPRPQPSGSHQHPRRLEAIA